MRHRGGVYSGMFEQSVLLSPKRSPWSMVASLSLQCSIVGAILLLSILHIERLNIDLLKPPPLRVPFKAAKLDAVEIVDVIRTGVVHSTTAVFQYRRFVEPSHIPTGIAIVDDIGSAPPALGSGTDFRPSDQGAPIGIVGGAETIHVAPPPPPPVQHTAQVVKPKDPFRVSLGVAEAKLIHRVVPPYPPLAKQMRISGTVRLMGVISTSGRIEKLEVVEGHPLLVKAAVEAVQQWIYRPTILNGEPVPVAAPIQVIFILNQ